MLKSDRNTTKPAPNASTLTISTYGSELVFLASNSNVDEPRLMKPGPATYRAVTSVMTAPVPDTGFVPIGDVLFVGAAPEVATALACVPIPASAVLSEVTTELGTVVGEP